MIRKAGFRGLWYPFTAEECRTYVGDIKRNGEITNGVLPHAGWPYSASMIKEYFSGLSEDVKRIIIISPSHYHYLKPDHFTICTFDKAETPFGNADVIPFTPRSSIVSDKAVADEHGVEMILPFIGMAGNICVSFALISEITSLSALDRLSDELSENIGTDTAVVASSDFTHYGPRFGYMPYGRKGLEKAIEKDSEAASLIAGGRTDEVFNAFRTGTICGIAAMMILSETSRKAGLHGWRGMHATSADSTGDDEDFVSYQTIYWR